MDANRHRATYLRSKISGSDALAFFGAFALGLVTVLAACGGGGASPGGTTSGGTSTSGAPTADGGAGACTACIQNSDCGGDLCAQVAGDLDCAHACPNGNECSADSACLSVAGADGTSESVCVPRVDACGSSGGLDASAPPTETCGSLVGPDVKAACHCSAKNGSCQPNGCYGGWWCDTASSKCLAPPATCTVAPDGGPPVSLGPTPNGTVGPNGGSVSRLYFAVVGDTRPPTINDTSGYPTSTITTIYSDLEALAPRPSFAVATGDYVFASPGNSEAATQLDLYLGARAKFSSVVFPALGNHECTGAVTSNCGPGTKDGLTTNYQAFVNKMLQPIGQTKPNYEIDIGASDGSWTSKFVFVAGNAWTSDDATWLDGVLAKPTTYTFIVRHEPKEASQAPGCSGSEAIMAKHPHTLALVGHTHTYGRTGQRQVTIGNGGAPLVSGTSYGFALLQQRTDGAIQVDMINYETGATDPSFRFAVHADGTDAP